MKHDHSRLFITMHVFGKMETPSFLIIEWSLGLVRPGLVWFCLLVCPEGIAFRVDLCFAGIYFLFSPHEISELPQLIAAKFCTVIRSVFNFIIPV